MPRPALVETPDIFGRVMMALIGVPLLALVLTPVGCALVYSGWLSRIDADDMNALLAAELPAGTPDGEVLAFCQRHVLRCSWDDVASSYFAVIPDVGPDGHKIRIKIEMSRAQLVVRAHASDSFDGYFSR